MQILSLDSLANPLLQCFPKAGVPVPSLALLKGGRKWWGWTWPLWGLQVVVTCFRGDEGTILFSSISLLPHHRDEKGPTATCCYHAALPHRLGSNHTNWLKTGNPKTVTFAFHGSITLSIFHCDRKLARSAMEVKPCSHFRSKERKHHRSPPCLYSFNKHLRSYYVPASRPRQEGHGTESARHTHCALVNFFTAPPPVSTASTTLCCCNSFWTIFPFLPCPSGLFQTF